MDMAWEVKLHSTVGECTCLVRGVLSASLLDDEPREPHAAEGVVARAAVHLRDESIEGCRADGNEHEAGFCLLVTSGLVHRHVSLAAAHLGNASPQPYGQDGLEMENCRSELRGRSHDGPL